jgi:hypothetical protein
MGNTGERNSMWPRAFGRDRDRLDHPAGTELVLAELADLSARLGRIEQTLADGPRTGDQPGRVGLRTLVARLDHRLAALAEAATNTSSPTSLTSQLSALAPLPVALAMIADQLTGQGTQLDRHQGTLAALTGALTQLSARLTAHESQHEALAALLADATATLRDCRDHLARSAPADPTRTSGADALALLIRLLSQPDAVPPLARVHDLICFRPQVVTNWLAGEGLSNAAMVRVRRVWRDARLVPAEATDNFNKRVRLPGGVIAYVMAVPIHTYADLRVPLPLGVPDAAVPPSA